MRSTLQSPIILNNLQLFSLRHQRISNANKSSYFGCVTPDMSSLKVLIEEAAAKLDTDSLRSLFDGHGVPDLLDSGLSLEEILAYAALADHTPCIQDCLKAGAKITREVMRNAHVGGEYETYRLLVPAGLDVNYHFGHAGGPLTEAVMARSVDWITFLLESGANPNIAAIAGFDAIEIAIKEKLSLTVVKLLVDHGAEFPRKRLLPLAAISGDKEVIEYLLQNGINPNESFRKSFGIQETYCTPLHLAAEHGHLDAVNLLLHYGANVEATDSDGATAMDMASSAGHRAVVSLLKVPTTASST